MSQDDPYATPSPDAGGQTPQQGPYGQQPPYLQQPPYGQQPAYSQQLPYDPNAQPQAYLAPGQSPYLPAGVRAGSMGARLVGRIIDLCIIGIPLAIVFFLIVWSAIGDAPTDPETGDLVLSDEDGTQLFVALLVWTLVSVIVGILYEVWMIAVLGATLGKMAMGLKVVDIDTGGLIGWGRSFVRWLIPFAGSFVCGIGQWVVYLSPFLDSTKINRGWQDKAARDVVIRTR